MRTLRVDDVLPIWSLSLADIVCDRYFCDRYGLWLIWSTPADSVHAVKYGNTFFL